MYRYMSIYICIYTCIHVYTHFVSSMSPPRQDVSDGHTVEGFADGSGRAQDPNGRELKVARPEKELPGLA